MSGCELKWGSTFDIPLRLGDYLVHVQDGDSYVITAELFRRYYVTIGAVRATDHMGGDGR